MTWLRLFSRRRRTYVEEWGRYLGSPQKVSAGIPEICYAGWENGSNCFGHRILFLIKSCHDIGMLRPILWSLGAASTPKVVGSGGVQCILDKMGAHFTLNCKDFDQKLPFYRIPIFSRTQNFAKEAKWSPFSVFLWGVLYFPGQPISFHRTSHFTVKN